MFGRQPTSSSLDNEKEIPIRRSSFRFRFALAVFTLLCAGTPSSAELGHPSDDARRYVWDLTSLFPDDAAWETERAAVTEKLRTIGRLKGTLGRNTKSLAEALDEIAALRRRAGRLELYSTLRSDADVKSERATMMAAAGPALANQVDAAVAFAGGEILGIGGGRVAEWLKAEPRLDIHRRRINRVLREASHSANPETLALLGDLGDWPEGLARTYWALQECDLPWPTMKGADGKDLTIDNAAFLRLRNATDSVERRTATELFLRRLAPLENVFGSLLTRRIEADATIARHRRFRDGIEAQLFREGLPSGAHRTMLDVVHANLPVLHRYLRLRARALGLEHLTFDAIRVPPATDNRNISVKESLANIIAASEPLGRPRPPKRATGNPRSLDAVLEAR